MASGPTSISLAWNPSTDNSANWWYCVQKNGAGCFRVNPPQTTFTQPKLWPGQTIAWSVVALDAAGNRSAASNTVTYTTPPDTTPPSPAPTLTATSVRPTWVSLAWTASTDDVSQVFYTLLQDGNSTYVTGGINTRSALILYLTPSTTYTFTVTARDTFGNAVQSNVLSVTTPAITETLPPTAPSNLRGFDAGSCEAWISWDQSTDDTDPQSEILYEVYVNGVHAGPSTTLGYSSSIVYGGPGVNRIVVKAVDTSGNASGPSNELAINLGC